MSDDRTCLSYWFPLIEAAGLPVPETRIVRTDVDLSLLLDGEGPAGFEAFLSDLGNAARNIGYPCFLRTGLGSGKHDWLDTCYLTDPNALGQHVYNLVEWSHCADFMGLNHDVWVVRALIPTEPLFTAFYREFPVTREFRVFVGDITSDGEFPCAVFPYWPEGSIAQSPPTDCPDWPERLAEASRLSGEERDQLIFLAGWAADAVGGGYWSADFLQDKNGNWWLTDMADGDRSFRADTEAEVAG